MDEGTVNIIELVLLIIKQAAQAIQDLKDGKIDPSKVDLVAARTGLINLPMLPEEPKT